MRSCDCVGVYVRWLRKCKYSVLIGWLLLVLVLGYYGAAPLVGLCRDHFEPPRGSAAAVARHKMQHYFGAQSTRASDILYFEVQRGLSILDEYLLLSLTNRTTEFLSEHLDRDMYEEIEFQGYYHFQDRGSPFSLEAPAFLSKDNTSSFIMLRYPKGHTRIYGQAMKRLVHSFRDEYVETQRLRFVGDGGTALGAVEASDAAAKSIERMDTLSLPIALVILAVSLNSVRLLILPLVTLFVAMVVAFGFAGLLARSGFYISAATPPVMMSMLLAVSIDYALFLLTRFKEELQNDVDVETAIHRMLVHSGHTICGSGFTLAFCFMSLLFFPIQLMQSIGIGVVLSILSAIAANLSIVPAGLFAMPCLFSDCRRVQRNVAQVSAAVPLAQSDVTSHAVGAGKAFESSVWFRWSMFATKSKALVLVLIILIGFGSWGLATFLRLEKSMDTLLMTPRNSVSGETIQRFGGSFSRGSTGPYKLLLLPKSANTIYDQSFWANSQALLEIVASSYGGDSRMLGTISSPMYAYNLNRNQSRIPIPMVAAQLMDPVIRDPTICNHTADPHLHSLCLDFMRSKRCAELPPIAKTLVPTMSFQDMIDACEIFQMSLNATTTPARNALYATLTPSEPPASQEAVLWAKKVRALLPDSDTVEMHLSGLTVEVMDAIEAIYARLPTVLFITLCCCLVLVGLLTKSVVFGVVSVVLIGWTIVVVFALGIAVYQLGIFGESAPVQVAPDGGLAWMVPALTFTVVLGLGLDYDIFLLGRVCEYRCKGFSDRASFAYGVAKTGPVITSAGIIMAIAFSGLMLSSIPMLNQVSLLLVVAVLIDTFFIRSVATPAVHAPLGRFNWWPRRVPEVGNNDMNASQIAMSSPASMIANASGLAG